MGAESGAQHLHHGPLVAWRRRCDLICDLGHWALREACRTAVLGGHLDVCDACDYSRPSYNSCRNRHCPKCQSLVQARWIEQRLERLLPVHYFHVVFTLPAQLRVLARRNQRDVYKILFEAATRTLLTLGHDEARLGGQLGITAVLHTWTRELTYHPHLHCIVTGGGLAPDGDRWVPARRKYLFPLKVVSLLFRRLFLEQLEQGINDSTIRSDRIDVAALLAELRGLDWVVYIKPPFAGPEQVFRYLGRYTHRVGISNQRLVSLDERGVCFATKNGKQVTVTPAEFIRRFLLHVLPPGFVKIRHYGLWASGKGAERLALARKILAAPPPPPSPPSDVEAAELEAIDDERTWQRRLLELTGIDVTRCPRCHKGRMVAQALPCTVPLAGVDTS